MHFVSCRLVRAAAVIVLLLAAGGTCVFPQEASQSEKLLALADELIPLAARLRGLQPKTPIQKGIKTKEEISQTLRNEAGGREVKGALEQEGVLLKKLGLIPTGMDYVDFRLKLLAEQIGGYYDPEKKALFVAGWLSAEEQKPALVHEITHALQDQYFDLGRMMRRDRASHNDDRSLAHQSFVEGDATAIMMDYLLEPMGMSFLRLPDLAPIFRMQLSMKSGQFEVLQSAPEYLREILMFPYLAGLSFQQKARANGAAWSAVDRMYADLPSSTEQILHPEKYLVRRDDPIPVVIKDPSPRLGKGWKLTYRNVLGEFSISLLLKLHLPEDVARAAACGWGGDQVILVRNGGTGESAVIFEARWDDKESSDRLYAALSLWLETRYPKSRTISKSASGFALAGDGEYHSLQRRGLNLRLVLGLPEACSGRIGGW